LAPFVLASDVSAGANFVHAALMAEKLLEMARRAPSSDSAGWTGAV
jgi:hypothetical protein